MTTETAIEQAAELVALSSPQCCNVTFHENGPPTVRCIYPDELPAVDVVATSPEHLVQLLEASRQDHLRHIRKWIVDSFSGK